MNKMVPVVGFVLLCCGMVVSGGLVVADANTQNTTASDANGERVFDTTTPEPGETVEITLNVELSEEAPVDYVDDLDPAFTSGEYKDTTIGGERTLPLFDFVFEDTVVITFSEVGPGTLEIVYELTVPEDAKAGTVYKFDGTLQVDNELAPIEGPSSIHVAGGLSAYTNDEGVVDEFGLRDAIDDWRDDEIETSTLRDAIDAWRSGEPVA